MWYGRKQTDSPLYLHTVPCSWGSALFGWHWMDFLKFFAARTEFPFYNFTEESGMSFFHGALLFHLDVILCNVVLTVILTIKYHDKHHTQY